MSKLTVTYAHAAPMLREKLIRACGSAATSTTIRQRRAYFQEAFAYGQALKVLAEADDTKDAAAVAGVFQLEAIPTSAILAAREYLKASADELLGEGWDRPEGS